MFSSNGPRSLYAPKIPQTVEELGIPQSLVLDLILRRTTLEGFSTLNSLSTALRMSVPIIEFGFRHLRQQQLLEVKGMIGNDYQFVLTAP